jgi:hypothetical protein
VGTGTIHKYTEPNLNSTRCASLFGSIAPPGSGPAIWVKYTLQDGSPIYVLYGHTATSWNDKSSGSGKNFKFNCSYTVAFKVGDKISSGEPIGFTAPFYLYGKPESHLHISVFQPKKQKNGIYYDPPSNGWGYSPINQATGKYVDPEIFFNTYYLVDN